MSSKEIQLPITQVARVIKSSSSDDSVLLVNQETKEVMSKIGGLFAMYIGSM